MQSIVARRTALGASPARLSRQLATTRRTYAQEIPKTPNASSPPPAEGPSQGHRSNLPLIAIVGLVCTIPLYYFTQGTMQYNKPVGSGQAAIKDIRREKGAEGEYRDPRDSGRKISDGEKQRKEAAASKVS